MPKRLIPVDNIVEQNVEEGLLLLHESGSYLTLNPTGALIWNTLKRHSRWDDLLKALDDRIEGPDHERYESQVERFVRDLESEGFIRIEE